MTHYTSYDLIEWGKPFEKRQNALPEPIGPEVLVRVTAAGLCHSDLHVQKGFMDLGQEGKLTCLLYTSPSPRDGLLSRMPSSA